MKYLTVIAVITLVAAVVDCQSSDAEWKEYKGKHRKTYKDPSVERAKRQNWERSNSLVKKHNAEAAGGKHKFNLKHNEFSDWSVDEKKRLRGSLITPAIANEIKQMRQKPLKLNLKKDPPRSLDWRTSNCLPAVKNQGPCGSCWAFAAITPLEFQTCVKEGTASSDYIPYSEQQVVDCSSPYGTNGCNGGWPVKAWDYVNATKFLHSNRVYSYSASAAPCKAETYHPPGKRIHLASAGMLPIKDEEDIKAALYTYGPIAASVHSNLESFLLYSSGIYDDPQCSTDGSIGDHSIVIIGYGTENNIDYWIIRNSWGTSWGDDGYMKIKRGVNQCNIATWPLFVEI